MDKIKIAVTIVATSLATLAFVIACGGCPDTVKAASSRISPCKQYEVKARKGQLAKDAVKLPSGWVPFAVSGDAIYMRHCLKR